jgi:hypothetical protein
VAAIFIPTPAKGQKAAEVCYLGPKELTELFDLKVMPDGMLQRFVAPVGKHNVQLQAGPTEFLLA